MATANDTVTLFNGFSLDRTRGCLVHAGKPVHLRPQSFQVLEYLVNNAGQLISKDKLIEAVWHGRAVTDGAVGKCIEDLRVVFGEEGRQYLRNVRGRGYIFDRDQPNFQTTHTEEIDVIRVVVEQDRDLQSKVAKADGAPTRTRWKGRTATAIVASAALFAAVAGYWVFARRQPSSNRIQSIAVMPLKNESGNSEVEYLSDGMTESLINSLSRLPGLSVKSRGVVFHYKNKDLEPRKLAADLSVQAILSGRFVQRGDQVTLYVSFVDGKTGNQIWGKQYDRKLDQLAELERETSGDIAEQLNSKLKPSDRTELSHGSTENSEAYRIYLKGRYYWNNPRLGYNKSRDYFQQAIDLDPTYALGYAGLSHYYGFAAANGMAPPDENWQRAESAVTKSLELDATLAETYNSLSGLQLYYHRDWTAAEASFKKGIELNQAAPEVRHHYSRCLMLFGRNEEAQAQMQRVLELEPLSIPYNLNAGKLFYFRRQYQQAVDQFKNTLELEPNSVAAHDWLGFTYEKMGNEKEAINEWSKLLVLRKQEDVGLQLRITYARSGFAAAVKMLAKHRMTELDNQVKNGDYVAASEYVTVYTRMGDKEKAFMWLEKAAGERNRFALEFSINPLYDSLRNDPRFQQLADSVKIKTGPQISQTTQIKSLGS
jgi:TolB-like protein/DNA-binding winged helix-turn-helix (wHTH) protein/Tfp pilus assembly protein PilF